jgi:hypothetical protein
VNCETVDQLKARERFYIENTPNCVNRNIPTRTAQEYYHQKYIENKDTILEERKQYYQDNRERVLQRVKAHQDNNPEKKKEQHHEWYVKNKEKLTEHRKQTFECVCGATVRIGGKSQHDKTKKHYKFNI